MTPTANTIALSFVGSVATILCLSAAPADADSAQNSMSVSVYVVAPCGQNAPAGSGIDCAPDYKVVLGLDARGIAPGDVVLHELPGTLQSDHSISTGQRIIVKEPTHQSAPSNPPIVDVQF